MIKTDETDVREWEVDEKEANELSTRFPGLIKISEDGKAYFEATKEQAKAYRRLIKEEKTEGLESKISDEVFGMKPEHAGALAGLGFGTIFTGLILFPILQNMVTHSYVSPYEGTKDIYRDLMNTYMQAAGITIPIFTATGYFIGWLSNYITKLKNLVS